MYDSNYWQRQIDYIMDCFDFYKVKNALDAIDWKWHNGEDDGVPSLYQLRTQARSLLKEVVEKPKVQAVGTGGLLAKISKDEGVISLKFVLADWESYDQ